MNDVTDGAFQARVLIEAMLFSKKSEREDFLNAPQGGNIRFSRGRQSIRRQDFKFAVEWDGVALHCSLCDALS